MKAAEDALSNAQKRLWFAHKMRSASPEFTVAWAARLHGSLDAERLRISWRRVLHRHRELRLRVLECGDEPRRDYWEVDNLQMRYEDASPKAVAEELDLAARKVFPLIDSPLAEAVLLRVRAEEHVLIIVAHHAVLDGRSLSIVVSELAHNYAGQPASKEDQTYLDYVVEERRSRPSEAQIDAWVDEIGVLDDQDPLGVPPATVEEDRLASSVRQPLSGPQLEAIRELAQTNRTTPQVIGLASFAATLSHYKDAENIVVGGTMDTRAPAHIDTVGMFVNPVPVRIQVDHQMSIGEYLGHVHRRLLRSYSHRGIAFEELVRRLRGGADGNRTPIFQVLFNYESRPPSPSLEGVRVGLIELPMPVSLYDLTLTLRDYGETAELVALYRGRLYSESMIRRIVKNVADGFSQMTLQRTVSALGQLSEAERGKQLDTGSGPALENKGTRPVHELFTDLAAENPHSLAVVGADARLTYQELEERSADLAQVLLEAGLRKEAPVGTLLHPSVEGIVSALAILRAGGTYVPMHPEYPQERIDAILSDAGIEIVITEFDLKSVQQVINPKIAASRTTSAPLGEVKMNDAAYIIYTSGSTGEPKGVVVEHGSLAASTAARREVYPGRHKFLLLSPMSFDSSLAGLWGTLTSGGCLVVAQREEIQDPREILNLLDAHAITMMLSVPALYSAMLDEVDRSQISRPTSLKTVITAGESLSEVTVERHFKWAEAAELVNEYGPTETSIWATYARFNRPEKVSIGKPIPGVRTYVLDRHDRLMPWGATGQLCISGPGLARGYLHRPQDTDSVFVPDPLGAKAQRMYRTGDYVRWTENGELEFRGRRDSLVKIRGQRVDLEAVESLMRLTLSATEVAAVTHDNATLTAFIDESLKTEVGEIRTKLARVLPPAMLPSSVRVVPGLPRTTHGKLNRERLKSMAQEYLTEVPARDGKAAPVSETIDVVHTVWCEVLKMNSVAHDINFFDAGGHSLLVPALRAKLLSRTGIEVSIVDLFTATTVSAQAELLTKGRQQSATKDNSSTGLRQSRLASAAARSRRLATK
ncbi:hypothetical protein UM93_15315 [Psychromicrobium lacuslunae]|uniref:Carrier domain-containing protein n=1 Tax=Psychromicrobium lacuslunae TaxID=1618207 RepID=A0A0D4C3Q2_9MICC|nr:hypothetical protein UM93_15315 [Psychromicrobium lacuslunae]